MDASCLFCRIAAGELPADKVHEDDHVLAFRDIDPQAPTHILLIPRRHVASLNDLRADHAEELAALLLAVPAIARDQGLAESGYRLVFNCLEDGGQVVPHLHGHILGGRRMQWPPG